MAACKVIGIPRFCQYFGSIIMDTHQFALNNHTDMACLTAVAANERFHAI
jgi:hypothetical protein